MTEEKEPTSEQMIRMVAYTWALCSMQATTPIVTSVQKERARAVEEAVVERWKEINA